MKAIKVKLYNRKMKDGRLSLFLDFYPAIERNGKLTRREFLKMYIYDKPRKTIDKEHNKETLKLAEMIRQKRESELNKPEIYSEAEKEQLRLKEIGKTDFLKYFERLANKRTGSNRANWLAAYKHLKRFANKVTIADLNELFCNDFKDYLLEIFPNQNTAASYFTKFKTSLKQAFRDGLLMQDLNAKIASIKEVDTNREFLTLQELQALAKTDCENPILKRASLFSCLTGLRFSDIQKLKWSEIIIDNGNYSIKYKQQKTRKHEVLPISEQAFNLLGEVKGPNEKVFTGLKYSAYENKKLHKWIKEAGITKHITFHAFRHTYATLQLENDTDIYTVSKLLGHKSLSTTQIYAKVLDKKKREAANKIKLDLD